MKFPCFVQGQNLVGICHRDATTFYFATLECKDDLIPFEDLFTEILRPNFESENYTFDVFLTNDEGVKVIDFNPWGAFT